MGNDYVVETTDLCKRYGQFEAVHALNLKVAGQQITRFLGRNGAGKSTTIKMLLGMTHPTTGTGTVLGRSIASRSEPPGETDYAACSVVPKEESMLCAALGRAKVLTSNHGLA